MHLHSLLGVSINQSINQELLSVWHFPRCFELNIRQVGDQDMCHACAFVWTLKEGLINQMNSFLGELANRCLSIIPTLPHMWH